MPARAQGAATAYRGPLDVVRHVLAERGAAGLFRGMAPTLVREVTGTAIMFAVYEAAKRRLAEAQVSASCEPESGTAKSA
jgi:solute carrier family 25 carnitine/acylcarnitine transporter 20/29